MTRDDVLAHPVIEATFEIIRLRTLFSALFESAHDDTGLTRMELTVLIGVSVAPAPPTVPQIGRSTGHPRQVIQKAANRVIELGLLETRRNPHHKRADLLCLTSAGADLADKLISRGGEIADDTFAKVVNVDWGALVSELKKLRDGIEAMAAAC